MICLREQERLNRTNEQLRAMVNLLLEESHTQGVTGTRPVRLLEYSAIRGEKNPQTKIPRGAPAPRSKPSSAPLHHAQPLAALHVHPIPCLHP